MGPTSVGRCSADSACFRGSPSPASWDHDIRKSQSARSSVAIGSCGHRHHQSMASRPNARSRWSLAPMLPTCTGGSSCSCCPRDGGELGVPTRIPTRCRGASNPSAGRAVARDIRNILPFRAVDPHRESGQDRCQIASAGLQATSRGRGLGGTGRYGPEGMAGSKHTVWSKSDHDI